jgi:hypothetical protein
VRTTSGAHVAGEHEPNMGPVQPGGVATILSSLLKLLVTSGMLWNDAAGLNAWVWYLYICLLWPHTLALGAGVRPLRLVMVTVVCCCVGVADAEPKASGLASKTLQGRDTLHPLLDNCS